MAWRIGVDIGGTFTDVAMVEESSGRIAVAKVPTTPPDFAAGVLQGLRQGLAENGIVASDVTLLSHATTVVTNALLEEKGARAAFITTRGFRDVLELRRCARADLYDLFQDAPAVLIPRRWRLRDHRPHRCPGRGGDAAGRGRGAGAGRRDPRGQASPPSPSR